MDVSWENVSGAEPPVPGRARPPACDFGPDSTLARVVESVSCPRPRERDPLQASLLPRARARAPRPSVR